jgi:hypothetical protein
MGLKGYRLWVMGQLDSNVQSPTGEHLRRRAVQLLVRERHQAVAVRVVAYDRKQKD